MEKIVRGGGFTASERYLARLSDRTFLKLWTYPNTFSDRNRPPGGDGKEICDLLVVCGDDVIVFSDKSVDWPRGPSLELSWSRWYRRAVRSSVDQIRGAERWLRDHPGRVFLDSRCTMPMPVDLPPPERRRFHGIAIVRGAREACSGHFQGDEGSLTIVPALKRDAHIDAGTPDWRPFAIGDVDPSGSFIHVLDETALDRVMLEMDTITDFVGYLLARADAIRNEHLILAPGESELLAYYMKTEPPEDRPKFLRAAADAAEMEQVALWPGAYQDYVGSAAYRRKKNADAPSYVWDRLIGEFVKHLMAGTSVSVWGEEPSASRAEPALRIMARESRLRRRLLGEALSGTLSEAARRREHRFTRIAVPGKNDRGDPELAYVFMVLAYPDDVVLGDGYRQYRKVRASMLETYCYAVLHDHRRLKRIVGIGMDTPGRSPGGSEDLLALEVREWSAELEKSVARRRTLHEVLVPGRLVHHRESAFEFPPQPGSRHERRAAARGIRKRDAR